MIFLIFSLLYCTLGALTLVTEQQTVTTNLSASAGSQSPRPHPAMVALWIGSHPHTREIVQPFRSRISHPHPVNLAADCNASNPMRLLSKITKNCTTSTPDMLLLSLVCISENSEVTIKKVIYIKVKHFIF